MRNFACLVVLVLLISPACQPPTGPAPVTVINQNKNINNIGGQPSPSPSPGTIGSGTIHTVKLVQFGETCPPGSGLSISGQSRSVRVGCTANLTCTPKRRDGTDASPEEHGPAPDSFGVTSGTVYVEVRGQDEAFNLDAKGVAAGQATFSCVVKGVRNDPPFVLTVVP